MKNELRRGPEYFYECDMFCDPPILGQVIVVLQGLVDFAHQSVLYEFRAMHLFQQFMPMPDRNIKIFGKQVHTEVIRHDDSGANLAECQNKAIGR